VLHLRRWGQVGIIAGFFFGWAVLAWLALSYTKHQKR
jgi:hypothetical protein